MVERTRTVRPAVEDDVSALARVHVASWRAAYRRILPDGVLDGLDEAEFEAIWRVNLLRDGRTNLVASEGGAAVAFLAYGNVVGRVVELIGLYVHPDCWREGHGLALLEEARGRWRADGHRHAVLWVLRANARARAFYGRTGFQPTGDERTAHLSGVSSIEIEYRRPITSTS